MPKLARYRAKHDPPPKADFLSASSASILHLDMDAFFVSVELLRHPELRGKPVVVGGQPDERGVVSAASYEARQYGIQSAMPLRTAGRLCPHAVFLDGHHELYGEWSDRVATILARYTPVVEMVSIDEAYLDLAGTQRLQGTPLEAAHRLLSEIWEKTQLPCSAGLARTRLVAKVASEQAKPRGLLWVPAGSEAAFFAGLPVRKIPGIGKVTEAALGAFGIKTVGELAGVSQERLEDVFGQWGTALYRKARGEDAYEFFVDAEPKSVSNNHTFPYDTDDRAMLDSMLSHLSQKAAKRLREAGLDARCITLTIRYAGFHTITRSKTLSEATHLDEVIRGTSKQLFEEHWDRRQRVRLLGVGLSSLAHGGSQLGLLDAERREKLERLTRAADRLRDRFGFSKIQFGGSLEKPEG
jgi:DNA polymerase-4